MKRFRIRIEELSEGHWRWWVYDSIRARLIRDGIEQGSTAALESARASVRTLDKANIPES